VVTAFHDDRPWQRGALLLVLVIGGSAELRRRVPNGFGFGSSTVAVTATEPLQDSSSSLMAKFSVALLSISRVSLIPLRAFALLVYLVVGMVALLAVAVVD
jgi:hypothetical protein